MCSPVTIASHLTPEEGEIARLRLAQEGIASYVSGADMLTWLWHLSNALHGATLQVRSSDAQRAAKILTDSAETPVDDNDTHDCVHCREVLPNDWDTCWRCGAGKDGAIDESFFVVGIRPSRGLRHLSGVQYLGLLQILIAVAIVASAPLAIVMGLIVLPYVFASQVFVESVVSLPESNAALPAPPAKMTTAEELCRRGLASAIFGFVWFPPLTFYSIWLLLESQAVSVGTKGRTWRCAAWAMNAIALATVTFFAMNLIEIEGDQSLFESMHQLLQDAFDRSAGFIERGP